jgi:hypothetical protein
MSTLPAGRPAKWRERLGWLALVALAVAVVCTGCFMLLAFALAAEGELEATALGSDWRMWALYEKGTNGFGVSQTHTQPSRSGEVCRETRIWLITWRPSLKIEPIVDRENCEAHHVPHRVAPASRFAIIHFVEAA